MKFTASFRLSSDALRRPAGISTSRRGARAAALVIGVLGIGSTLANLPREDTLGQIAPSRCELPKYPPISLRAGETGSVVLAVLVAADGSVKKIEVHSSSGYARLDQAAIKAFRRCRFPPPVVDGEPGEAWGLMRYSFTQDPLPSKIPESFAEIWHRQYFVTAMSARCLAHDPDMADGLTKATAAWHTRNDELLRRLDDEKQRYYAEISRPFNASNADAVTHLLDAALENDGTRSGSLAEATFEAFDETEQQAYCRRFTERLDGGQLDLMGIVIRFPDLEAALAPAADVPSP